MVVQRSSRAVREIRQVSCYYSGSWDSCVQDVVASCDKNEDDKKREEVRRVSNQEHTAGRAEMACRLLLEVLVSANHQLEIAVGKIDKAGHRCEGISVRS